jgi:hypothetical protein
VAEGAAEPSASWSAKRDAGADMRESLGSSPISVPANHAMIRPWFRTSRV